MRSNKMWLIPMLFLLCGIMLPSAMAAEDETCVNDQCPEPKKAAKTKRQGHDYGESKYKSYGVLTNPESQSYRFDAKGNPIPPALKKKSGKKVGKAALRKESPAPAAGEYVCPMGDYHGPQTKDGRCPKCGMALQKKQAAINASAGQMPHESRPQAQQAVYACPMGDYRGPQTQDGRCPKCGMMLQKQ